MYQALYRKYRPKNFDDVVGQNFVIKTLKNAILNDKINHAYMFFGPRGIGKTTIAKILSRAVNCDNNATGNPCENCESCKKSISSVDIIEIDAASNNGVDEIREIKNNVNIVPTELKYKVYIIDEVHMLTASAFNALLKTLEEPPKHVIFILATTDPQKVSETIISRCQCYSFKRINVDDIVTKLKEVCSKESISIDDEVLIKIAEYSNGGLRDSLGTLDKLSSYKNENITIEDFYEINDMLSTQELNSFKNYIINLDTNNVIDKIKKYNDGGKNIVEIMIQLLANLRNDIVEYYTSNNDIDIDKYMNLANLINEKMIDIKKNSNPRIYIEIMLLNFINNYVEKVQIISREINNDTKSEITLQKKEQENIQEEKIISREIKNTEENAQESSKYQEIESTKESIQEKENISREIKKSNIEEIIKVRVNNVLTEASKDEKNNDTKRINSLNEFVFDQHNGYLVSELLNANICASSKDGIILSYEYDSVVEQNINQIEKLTDIFSQYTKTNKKLAIITNDYCNTVKKEYINSIKNGQKYDIIEEPELIVTSVNSNTDETSSSDAMDLFKDIIEIE